jgi:Cu(I)/Ag(I) efflux system membrane protein CusA/SilA
MLNKSIKFLIENKLVAVLMLVLFVGWGIVNAPFNWDTGFLPSNPVAVDAIPDIGENQQIVYTKWDGRSPQDRRPNYLPSNDFFTRNSRSKNHP